MSRNNQQLFSKTSALTVGAVLIMFYITEKLHKTVTKKLTSFLSALIHKQWTEQGSYTPTLRPARFETKEEADAIVIGSGINGLVAAAELAQAGWSVILLERNAEIGEERRRLGNCQRGRRRPLYLCSPRPRTHSGGIQPG
jgi:hypothetical protein